MKGSGIMLKKTVLLILTCMVVLSGCSKKQTPKQAQPESTPPVLRRQSRKVHLSWPRANRAKETGRGCSEGGRP